MDEIEPGEYFVGAREALLKWFVDAYPVWPDDIYAGHDRIINVYRNGAAVLRRSHGAAEHR